MVIFMEKDTENEANFPELTKKFKQVTFIQVLLMAIKANSKFV